MGEEEQYQKHETEYEKLHEELMNKFREITTHPRWLDATKSDNPKKYQVVTEIEIANNYTLESLMDDIAVLLYWSFNERQQTSFGLSVKGKRIEEEQDYVNKAVKEGIEREGKKRKGEKT